MVVVAARSSGPDPATRAAAARELAGSGAAALDLIPGELSADRLLRVLRRVDPARLGTDVLYSPGGAHEALALRPDLAARLGARLVPGPDGRPGGPGGGLGSGGGLGAGPEGVGGGLGEGSGGLGAGPVGVGAGPNGLDGRPDGVGAGPDDLEGVGGGRDGLDGVGRAALARTTVAAQRHAPARTALRVAPDLRAAPAPPDERWRELEELTAFARFHGSLAPLAVGVRAAHLVALAAGPFVAPAAGIAALAAWSAQPALALAGRRRPTAVVRASLGRLAEAAADTVRTARAGHRRSREERRALAAAPPVPAPPADQLFEPRRATCPWCGAAALAPRLDTVDLFLHRPGRFHLDRCTACGHVFQNPALSVAGLGHYYDQFYDGLGEELAERTFAGMAAAYAARAAAVARARDGGERAGRAPARWLDVGTGHGHFCLHARQRWPATCFDGLDTAAAVEEAERRGWLDAAHRGLFPEVAGGLPQLYDVVTMHHYLEHTRDPRLELETATKVLEPGGILEIEMPDPASPWTRLGRWWLGWLQPQHLHLIPHDNLVEALRLAGFEVVATERATADDGGLDLFLTVFLAVDRLAPNPRLPWRPRPGVAYRAGRLALFAAATPALVAALTADVVKNAVVHRPGSRAPANAYRIVARRAPVVAPDPAGP
ncbi:MAG TPA: class I SAM-dependent methyltransferase [Acidimicrobiales bacterium]